jgi:hypothetical protein
LISAYVLAGELASGASYQEAFAAHERVARSLVESNQDLVSEGRTTMMPRTEGEIEARNAILRGERGADLADLNVRSANRVYSSIDLPNN